MFVSFAERTREIGIRKAIGARRRTILLQFLLEAAAIRLLGGVLALADALITGGRFRLSPAWRTSRLSPVDALRQE